MPRLLVCDERKLGIFKNEAESSLGQSWRVRMYERAPISKEKARQAAVLREPCRKFAQCGNFVYPLDPQCDDCPDIGPLCADHLDRHFARENRLAAKPSIA